MTLGKPGGTWRATISYPSGGVATAAVAADFNGDGKLDLAVVNTGVGQDEPGSVSVLLGNGDGTFRGFTNYATGRNSLGIVAGDFNADGRLDIAVANFDGDDVSILFGNGDGTFQNQITVSVGVGPTSISSGDFNGDGRDDLITGNLDSGTVSVLLDNGNGGFTRVDSPAGVWYTDLLVADFNADGKLDVVVPGALSVLLLLGNGDGSFQSGVVVLTPPSGLAPAALAVADFNHDTKLDLAVGTAAANTGTLYVLFGNGDGTFQQPIASVIPGPTSLVAADINNDGQLDLIDSWQSGYVYIVLGNGDGTFGSQQTSPLPEAVYAGPGVAADFNGDGKLDVAAAQNNVTNQLVSVALGNGNGTFQPAVAATGDDVASEIVSGDFNGDGRPDVATLGAWISVFLGNGDGTLQGPIDTSFSPGIVPESFAAGDFNGDGKTDLVAVYMNTANNTTATIYLSNGDGTFRVGSSYSVGTVSYDAHVVSADLNSDGKLDLVVSSPSQYLIFVLLGNGDGTFQSPTSFSSEVGVYGTIVVADFNQDGRLDLGVEDDGSILVYPGNGDGTFGSPVASDEGADQVTSFAVGDFNDDGKLDLALEDGEYLLVLLGYGDCSFQYPLLMPGTQNLGNVIAGDFNSDGIADLLFPNDAYPSPQLNLLPSRPFVTLSTALINFKDQRVGTSSEPQELGLINIGNAPLSVSSVLATGNFSQTNTCGDSIGAGANCTVSVTFVPAMPGTSEGTVAITDSAVTSPQTVALTGVGLGPAVRLSPTHLNFGKVGVGQTSSPMSVLLTNTGNRTLDIRAVDFTGRDPGDFAETTNCGSTLDAGKSCSFSVTFAPQATGNRSAALTIGDNAAGSPQSVTVSGTGE